MAQLNQKFYDLLKKLRDKHFEVHTSTGTGRIEITVRDVDGVEEPFASSKDQNEAFIDFARMLKDKFDWTDESTGYDMFMADLNKRTDEREAKRAKDPLWNPTILTEAETRARDIIESSKQRTEHTVLTPELAGELLWEHLQVRKARDMERDADLEALISGNELFFDQRKYSDRHGSNLMAVMERGEWLLTHQGIALDEEGFILDGQHRAMAVVASGIAVPIAITYNVDPKVFPVIDTGKPRTAGDILAMLKIKNPGQVATVIRLLYYYDNVADVEKWYNEPLSNEQIRQQLVEKYIDIGDAYDIARSLASSRSWTIRLSATAIAAAHYIITRAHPRARVDEFWHNVKGQNIHPFFHDHYRDDEYNFSPGHALNRWAAREYEVAKDQGHRRRKGGLQKNTRELIMILRAWNDTADLLTRQRYHWMDLDAPPAPKAFNADI